MPKDQESKQSTFSKLMSYLFGDNDKRENEVPVNVADGGVQQKSFSLQVFNKFSKALLGKEYGSLGDMSKGEIPEAGQVAGGLVEELNPFKTRPGHNVSQAEKYIQGSLNYIEGKNEDDCSKAIKTDAAALKGMPKEMLNEIKAGLEYVSENNEDQKTSDYARRLLSELSPPEKTKIADSENKAAAQAGKTTSIDDAKIESEVLNVAKEMKNCGLRGGEEVKNMNKSPKLPASEVVNKKSSGLER